MLHVERFKVPRFAASAALRRLSKCTVLNRARLFRLYYPAFFFCFLLFFFDNLNDGVVKIWVGKGGDDVECDV